MPLRDCKRGTRMGLEYDTLQQRQDSREDGDVKAVAKEGSSKRKVVSQTSPEDQFSDYNPNMPAPPPPPPEPKAEEQVAPVETVVPSAPAEVAPAEVVTPVALPEPVPETKHNTSPLAHAGPMPAELLRDPYAVEIVPLTTVAPVPSPPAKTKLLTQERMVWISAVAVSWAVTAIAVLRILRII